ncbi:MAG: hypothetical protein WBQ95_14365 [Terracidiphilus sp.]
MLKMHTKMRQMAGCISSFEQWAFWNKRLDPHGRALASNGERAAMLCLVD